MYHDFVDTEITVVNSDFEDWCSEHIQSEYLVRKDIFDQYSDGHKIQRVYFANKKDANKFKKEFRNDRKS